MSTFLRTDHYHEGSSGETSRVCLLPGGRGGLELKGNSRTLKDKVGLRLGVLNIVAGRLLKAE